MLPYKSEYCIRITYYSKFKWFQGVLCVFSFFCEPFQITYNNRLWLVFGHSVRFGWLSNIFQKTFIVYTCFIRSTCLCVCVHVLVHFSLAGRTSKQLNCSIVTPQLIERSVLQRKLIVIVWNLVGFRSFSSLAIRLKITVHIIIRTVCVVRDVDLKTMFSHTL